MNRVIAIEGPDKAGKTTLGLRLCIKNNITRMKHFSAPKSGSKVRDQYHEALLYSEDTVIDRWALGEMIYGPMLREKSKLSRLDLKVLLRLFNTKSSVFVMVLPDPKELASRKMTGDDPVNTAENLNVLVKFNNWLNFMDNHVVNFVSYNPDMITSVDKCCDKITGLLEGSDHRGGQYFGAAYGNLDGKYLIIGEAVNQKKTWLDFPFTQGRCSEFLAESLEAGGIDEKDCYFMNADNLFIPHVAQRFKDKAIITLGKAAAERVKAEGFSSYELPHPQFWLRFQYKDLIKYSGLLNEIREDLNARIYDR